MFIFWSGLKWRMKKVRERGVMSLRGAFLNYAKVAITASLFSMQAVELHTEKLCGSVCTAPSSYSSPYKPEL